MKNTTAMHDVHGFTIIELLVVITIIAILTAITLSAPSSVRKTSRDQERNEDIHAIARRLEQSYSGQELGAPSYPSTVELLNDIANNTRTVQRLGAEALRAPGRTTSSIVAATNASHADPSFTSGPLGNPARPTVDEYVYQPITSSGTLCTANPSAANPCVLFTLYYRNETSTDIQKVTSMHQQ